MHTILLALALATQPPTPKLCPHSPTYECPVKTPKKTKETVKLPPGSPKKPYYERFEFPIRQYVKKFWMAS